MWLSFMFHLARALICFPGSGVGGFFRALLGGMPCLLCSVLDGVAGIFGRIFRAVPGIFHVTSKAVLSHN